MSGSAPQVHDGRTFGPDPSERRVLLGHRGFTALGAPHFRRDAEGLAVMAVLMGEQEAVLPVVALQLEFAPDAGSPDRVMLGLVTQALDYVVLLRPGDPLPAEALTGEASWEPTALHRQLASARLQRQLVRWQDGAAAGAELVTPTPQVLLAWVDEPGVRQQVQFAMRDAAARLDLANGAAAASLMEALASELGYIEALRDTLLTRAQMLDERLLGLERGTIIADRSKRDLLAQVRRLLRCALAKIKGQFDAIDMQVNDIVAALLTLDTQRTFIRTQRDLLHRSETAWRPILMAWEAQGTHQEKLPWTLVARTYQFLAPRFMTVQEWKRSGHASSTGVPASQIAGSTADRRTEMLW